MKKIKYCMAFVLFLFGIILSNECIIGNFLGNPLSDSYSQITIHDKSPNLNQQILDYSNKYNVKTCMYIIKHIDNIHSEIKFVCSQNAEQQVKEAISLPSTKFKSLLYHNYKLGYCTFKDINESEYNTEYVSFYLIGNENDVDSVKALMEENFNVIRYTKKAENNYIQIVSISIWLLITILISFFTYYNITVDQKKYLVKISFGHSPAITVTKNILSDTFILLFEFCIGVIISARFTSLIFCHKKIICLVLLVFMINSLMYLKYLKHDYRLIINSAFNDKKTLKINYMLKMISSVFITTSLTLCLISMNSLTDYIKAGSVIKNFKGYYSINIDCFPEKNELDNKVRNSTYEKIYRNYFRKTDALMLDKLSDDTIYANNNAYAYLADKITPLRSCDMNEDIYILIPDNLSKKDEKIQQAVTCLKEIEGNEFVFTYKAIEYKTGTKILYFDQNLTSMYGLIKNPVIIYNTINPDTLTTPLYSGDFSRTKNNVLYNLTDDQFKEISEQNSQNPLKSKRNNLYDSFCENIKNQIIISSGIIVVALLIFFTEIIVMYSIVKMEYRVNALRLSLLKIYGYTAFNKHSGLIAIYTILQIISTFISLFVVSKLCAIDKNELISTVCIISCILFLIEMAVTFINIARIEKTNIQKILKGGAL